MINEPMWKCPEFQTIADAVEGYTVVEKTRLFVLWQLVSQAAPGGDLVEVGVWRGGSGMVIAEQARRCHPDALVLLYDTFEGIPHADAQVDSGYRVGEFQDTNLPIVRDLATRLAFWNVLPVQGVFPRDFHAYKSHIQFSFAHIDCDVYQSARESWEFIWPRVVPGGIVVFDDYGEQRSGGLTRCVNEIAACPDPDFVWLPSPMIQAIFIKKGR